MNPAPPRQDPAAPDAGKGAVDWARLYDAHPEYEARRGADSHARRQVDLEVRRFKLPHLVELLQGRSVQSLVEIGCATGELTAAFPLREGGRRLGIDISEKNVAAARERFPHCEFEAGDFRAHGEAGFDLVLLSDVLEHVPDDAAFLAAAARLGRQVLVNLPLEDNWLNRGRAYGPQDASGHLRAYSLAQGLELMQRAGLEVERWNQVWIHETPAEGERRELRRQLQGHAFAGGALTRPLRAAVFALATSVRPLGRKLFASNLFLLARRGS